MNVPSASIRRVQIIIVIGNVETTVHGASGRVKQGVGLGTHVHAGTVGCRHARERNIFQVQMNGDSVWMRGNVPLELRKPHNLLRDVPMK